MDHVLNALADTSCQPSTTNPVFQPAPALPLGLSRAKAFPWLVASIEARTRPQLCAQTDAMHLALKIKFKAYVRDVAVVRYPCVLYITRIQIID